MDAYSQRVDAPQRDLLLDVPHRVAVVLLLNQKL